MRVVQRKVCLLGDFAVGKTSLIRRFVEGRFDDRYLSTIGVKISRRSVDLEDSICNLLIWDLVGGHEFDHKATNYLRGTAGALIVCDLTRPRTFNFLSYATEQLLALNPTAAIIYLGNKVDLTDERKITDEQLSEFTQENPGSWLLTSAKTGEQVETAFRRLTEQMAVEL
jgi:small GTP-binding protein